MRIDLSKLHTLLAPFVMATLLTACTGDDSAGTDTDTATTQTATDTSTGTDTAAAGACGTYCTAALANCADANTVYDDMDQCMSACAAMPEGADGDVDGNSAYCRAYHAGDPAAGEPGTHCAHATAHGGGVCGTPCDAYCDQTMANCSGDNALYAAREECMATCAAFPSGEFNAKDGNSVECRTYHSSFPAAAEAATHCPHTTAHGGGVCGDLCDGYCAQAMANCGVLYADIAECMGACGMFPTDGDWNATAGDSVQCRTYHASFPAAGMAAVHCAHAAVDGGGVCV